MANTFITVQEAKELIKANCKPLPVKQLQLEDALNCVLAEDIYSPVNIPGFMQSAMDGYAIRFSDFKISPAFRVNGESFAGNTEELVLEPQTAARIFTGAPLPANADTVVMQEQVTRIEDNIVIDSPRLTEGTNVRHKGAEIKQDALAMEKGELLTPPAIGYLSGLGITGANVYPFPRVCIVTTGTEIIPPGTPLQFGQVYESNTFALKSALKNIHVKEIVAHSVADNISLLQTALTNAINNSDLVLVTGGVSVGDYDLVPAALANCGVETVFHKVKQRPGKPLLFGTINNKVVFGLPGNPSSVLSCFYNYVLPAIQHLMQRSIPFIETRMLPITHKFEKQIPLTQFLKGRFDSDSVFVLGAQESFRLSSFAVANCLIEISAEKKEIAVGDLVQVHVLR